ncbi:unnamed protein product, partial [Dibothriocephalus latus]
MKLPSRSPGEAGGGGTTISTAKPKCTAVNSPDRTPAGTRLIGSRCSGAATIQSRLSTLCSPRFAPPELPIHASPPRHIDTANANNNINVAALMDHSPPQSSVRLGSQKLSLEGHLDQPLPLPRFTSSPTRDSASEALILDEVGSRGGGVVNRHQVVPPSPPFSVKYAWETTFSLLSQEEAEEEDEEEDSAVVSPGPFSPPSTSSGQDVGSGSFLSKKHRRMSKSLPNFS